MTTHQSPVCIGIDPGWQSCGWSFQLLGKVVKSGHYVPADQGSIVRAVDFLTEIITANRKLNQVESVACDAYIERFVAYKNVLSEASEQILMFIGALQYALLDRGYEVHMVRAIDWKPKVCKYLVRSKEFNNPYSSFDKKYSILAAQTLSGIEGKMVDHEADAICLSYLNIVNSYESNRKARPSDKSAAK